MIIEKKIFNRKNVFVVIGASNDPEKSGYKIYKELKSRGFTVYPVNPKRETIQNDKAYPSIVNIPKKADVISIVTPPKITEKILEEVPQLKDTTIWFQPGSYNKKIIKKAKKLDIPLIYDQCILVDGINR